MTLLITVLLLVLAFVRRFSGTRGGGAWPLGLAIVAVLAVGSGFLARCMLPYVQAPAGAPSLPWAARNTIVLLGAGTTASAGSDRPAVPFFGYSRVAAAAMAYFTCSARGVDCRIVVSGGDPQSHGATEASVYAGALRKLKVPAADISLEPRSRNTWENARESVRLVPEGRLLVVVTSGFQMPRALLYFSHFRPGVLGYASDRLEPELTPIPTSENFMITDALLHEQVGIARYHVYNALGWNAPKTDGRTTATDGPASKAGA